MKNTRVFVIIAVAAALVATMILWKHFRSVAVPQATESSDVSKDSSKKGKKSESDSDNGERRPENSTAPDIAQASAEQERRLSEMGITPGMTKEQMQQRLAELGRAQREAVAENWRKPIEFYGIVIDQDEKPVSGVQIHFLWTDTSANGSSEANQMTDTQGKFSLGGTTGRLLQVWLSKDGYYVPKTNQNNFDYATGYTSDPNNPIIFRLVKKGEGADLITSQHGMSSTLNFSVSTPDGSPARVDFFNQKVGKDGQMEISQNKPAYGEWRTTTGWSYRLAIPDGGFVETDEEFPFEAPAVGYQSVIEFKFQKGEPNWTERIDKKFYVVFGNPRKYGRIHIETSMTTGTILEYAINPDGSRNLEPK